MDEPLRGHSLLGSLGGGLELIARHHPLEPLLIIALTLLAGVVRCWKISRPASIVFDEVHFGGFASKYIRSEFFMDVHPPLIKLLFALVGWLSGYDGTYEFKEIGSDYSDRVPYLQMRLVPALLGVAVVPIAYLTLRMLHQRPLSASLGALLLTFENALIVQSRFILLDSPLLFFTALAIFFHTGFCNEDSKRTFTRTWWVWLSLTGLSLGLVLSSKWIGLFTITAVGLLTIKQLWELLGDLRIPLPILIRSFLARFLCLAILPLLVYISIFAIHLAVLSGSGDGDAFMSSEFQQTLRGHTLPDTFADVLIGSNITIKHTNTLGGYLHSHAQFYPTGSHQQQITLYPHHDENNLWTVLGRLADDLDIIHRKPPDFYYKNRVPVNGSTFIRLNHPLTDKRLHTHDIRPSVSEVDYQNEVSGYGFPNYPGDANDEWIIEIVSKESDVKADPISARQVRALRTKFRLRHSLQNCYLFSHKVRLPDWGFGQQEVTCNRNPTLASSLWYIESNYHPLLDQDKDAVKVNYHRPSFWAKFWELQTVMWQTNKALVQHHSYSSRPSSWPVLKRGMNFWAKDHRQIYLIGNPFIWWLSTAAILFYLLSKTLLILRIKRGYHGEARNLNVIKYDGISAYLVVGWATHYLPFYLMSRQVFLHHYFPSLYYAIFQVCTVFDFATSRLSSKARLKTFVSILIITIWTWSIFKPLSYASSWTRSQCERARWRRTWDFSCHDFPEHLLEPIMNVFQLPADDELLEPSPKGAHPYEPVASIDLASKASHPVARPVAASVSKDRERRAWLEELD
ncbi:hypothetical protein PtA15_5A109 [Puccinia triticina]|uniref:Dolichyl-phosphate-mannose--protein mannosyltransferase n=1 Tax=Puccinia triticina TaxID=208348 RepID=A0ABY7CH11_9BASI|nr:uncharacterized protein PtA15_5A109 [Puccinia triticina]WAQ84539.1 hypothetical protein PtA15_5A109 [Puccinia triticina]WAR57882.1 hypothetical protein PtB15_5B112 [Puccinia triticina]